MKYKVRSIDGHYVTVDFENGTWATAVVHHNLQPDDIDKVFGQYTQEYELAKIPTERISVGEERETVDPHPETENSAKVIDYNNQPKAVEPDPFRFDFGKGNDYADPIVMQLMASYLAEKGQTALKDCLDAKLKAIADNAEFSVDTFIEKLNDTL